MFFAFRGRYNEELRARWFGYRIPAGKIHLLVSRTVRKGTGGSPNLQFHGHRRSLAVVMWPNGAADHSPASRAERRQLLLPVHAVCRERKRPSLSRRFEHASFFFTCSKVDCATGRQTAVASPRTLHFMHLVLYKKPMKSNIVTRDCLLGLGSCHGSGGQPLASVPADLGSVLV